MLDSSRREGATGECLICEGAGRAQKLARRSWQGRGRAQEESLILEDRKQQAVEPDFYLEAGEDRALVELAWPAASHWRARAVYR